MKIALGFSTKALIIMLQISVGAMISTQVFSAGITSATADTATEDSSGTDTIVKKKKKKKKEKNIEPDSKRIEANQIVPPQAIASEADIKYDSYLSLSLGTVKSDALSQNAFISNETGAFKTVEFYWGNKDSASFLGGVRTDQDNKLYGYYFNYVLKDKDIISIANWTNSGIITLGDNWSSVVWGSLGQYNASRTEFSYITQGEEIGRYTTIIYGTSNFPMNFITNSSSSTMVDALDANQSVRYLAYGGEINPIRAALLNGKRVEEVKGGGTNLYLISALSIGLEQVSLSSNQAGNYRDFCCYPTNFFKTGTAARTVTYYNPNTKTTTAYDLNPGGLNNQSALFISSPIYFETGYHFFSKRSGSFNMIGTLGAYLKYEIPVSWYLSQPWGGNQLSDGTKWYPGTQSVYGAIGKLSATF